MAAELDYDKLVKLVKGDNEITQSKAAQKLGLSIGQVSMLKFQQARVAAGVLKKQPATAKSVKDLRDKQGHRWEAIAAMTGLSPAAVKAKYEEAGGNASSSYVGRGRNHSASGTATKRSSAKSATKTKTKTATKRASGAATKRAAGRGQVVRRTTRRSGAGNPS